MWEPQITQELLEDAVLELQNERDYLKRLLKDREAKLVRLKDALKDATPSNYSIYKEPQLIPHAGISAVIEDLDGTKHAHVVGVTYEKDRMEVLFTYDSTLESPLYTTEQILETLHRQVIKELKTRVKK